jgi:hypothetical protein
MSALRGLKKLLSKKDRFAPPNQYTLTAEEKESVIVLFSIIGCTIIITVVLLFINQV